MGHIYGLRRYLVLSVVVGGLLFVAIGSVGAQTWAPVSEAQVVTMKLNHYFTPDKKSHTPDFDWTFTKTEFVLKKGTGAIPADLLEKLLPNGMIADEIRGKWKLANNNNVPLLVLTDIKAGNKDVNKNVNMPIYRTAKTLIRVGEPRYMFALGE